MRQIFFVSLPFVAWFVVVPHSIVQLIYQHGHFTAVDTAAVAPILAFFTLGMAFANVNVMFNRGFQSLQRPWLPLYVGLVNLGLNALLDWALYGRSARAASCCRPRSCRPSTSSRCSCSCGARSTTSTGAACWSSLAKILVCSAALASSRCALWHGLRSLADSGCSGRSSVVVVAVFGGGGLVYLGAA